MLQHQQPTNLFPSNITSSTASNIHSTIIPPNGHINYIYPTSKSINDEPNFIQPSSLHSAYKDSLENTNAKNTMEIPEINELSEEYREIARGTIERFLKGKIQHPRIFLEETLVKGSFLPEEIIYKISKIAHEKLKQQSLEQKTNEVQKMEKTLGQTIITAEHQNPRKRKKPFDYQG